MGRILAELQQERRKGGHSHWAWWVFPTEIVGARDPAATCITATTAEWLVSQDDGTWRRTLEKVCELADAEGARVLPDADHGRVHHFLRFWSRVDAAPLGCVRYADAFLGMTGIGKTPADPHQGPRRARIRKAPTLAALPPPGRP